MTDAQEARALAAELGITPAQASAAIALLDEENTVWFIARYRKERTGGLDEEVLLQLAERLRQRRALEARRAEVLRLLEKQGVLSAKLEAEVRSADSLERLEDIYRPFRPKRRTRASIAREKGLAPLARAILRAAYFTREPRGEPPATAKEMASRLLPAMNGVSGAGEALAGASDIVAEAIADHPDVRRMVREWVKGRGVLRVEAASESGSGDKDGEAPGEFDHYKGFRQPISRVRPYQTLAIDRGERLGALKVRVEVDPEPLLSRIRQAVVSDPERFDFAEPHGGRADLRWESARGNLRRALEALRDEAIRDGWRRLLEPSVEREVRSALTEQAHAHAIAVFGANLRQLLLQPPIRPSVVLAIDPAFRTGCKVAVLSETGELLATTTIYPHAPQDAWRESVSELVRLIETHGVDVIAVGNGTASHQTQILAAEVISKAPHVRYTVVNEAGASVYSASKEAREEFPDLDVTLRGAVSIGRRLQDPLAELVKIDPRSIGVGLYQHDIDQNRLSRSLATVVESCVNRVGVELNTASESLLKYVSGLSSRQAAAIVAHRRRIGRFKSREQLLDVAGIGPKTFEQCAGFLRIRDGDEPLDATPIHPESYGIARRVAAALAGGDPARFDVAATAAAWGVGAETLADIVEALTRPRRDPREALPPPLLRSGVLELEDLEPGMVLDGRVANVVDFGAFVDIGLKKAGLVHISEMGDGRVRDPFDVVSVGDAVRVRVVDVDVGRGRISLSLRLEDEGERKVQRPRAVK